MLYTFTKSGKYCKLLENSDSVKHYNLIAFTLTYLSVEQE